MWFRVARLSRKNAPFLTEANIRPSEIRTEHPILPIFRRLSLAASLGGLPRVSAPPERERVCAGLWGMSYRTLATALPPSAPRRAARQLRGTRTRAQSSKAPNSGRQASRPNHTSHPDCRAVAPLPSNLTPLFRALTRAGTLDVFGRRCDHGKRFRSSMRALARAGCLLQPAAVCDRRGSLAAEGPHAPDVWRQACRCAARGKQRLCVAVFLVSRRSSAVRSSRRCRYGRSQQQRPAPRTGRWRERR